MKQRLIWWCSCFKMLHFPSTAIILIHSQLLQRSMTLYGSILCRFIDWEITDPREHLHLQCASINFSSLYQHGKQILAFKLCCLASEYFILVNGYEMTPSGQALCEQCIAVATHLSERLSVCTKQNVHAHKSVCACNYVLCAGENVSLLGYWTPPINWDLCSVPHNNSLSYCSYDKLCAVLSACTLFVHATNLIYINLHQTFVKCFQVLPILSGIYIYFYI